MAQQKHIRLLTPAIGDMASRLEDVKDLERDDLKITQAGILFGPASVESEFDEALAASPIVNRAVEAEREGVDAVIVDCMSDPGLEAARECVRIPVMGPRLVCAHVATMLGHRFSFISVKSRTRPRIERHLTAYGLHGHLASVRAVDLSVLDAISYEGRNILHKRIIEEAISAVEQDKADVIIVGCTGFFGCEKVVAHALETAGHTGIPVLNPMRTTITVTAALLDVGVTHSLKAYPFTPHPCWTAASNHQAIPAFAR